MGTVLKILDKIKCSAVLSYTSPFRISKIIIVFLVFKDSDIAKNKRSVEDVPFFMSDVLLFCLLGVGMSAYYFEYNRHLTRCRPT